MLVVAAGAWFVAWLLVPSITPPIWLALPLIGILMWRFEGRGFIVSAPWTLSIGIALLLAERIAGPVGVGLALAGYVAFLSMLFSATAIDRWYRLARALRIPGAHSPSRRGSAIRLVDLDGDARAALDHYAVTGDRDALHGRLVDIASQVHDIELDHPAWASAQVRMLDWLMLLVEIAKDPGAHPDADLEAMSDQREAFEAALAATGEVWLPMEDRPT